MVKVTCNDESYMYCNLFSYKIQAKLSVPPQKQSSRLALLLHSTFLVKLGGWLCSGECPPQPIHLPLTYSLLRQCRLTFPLGTAI